MCGCPKLITAIAVRVCFLYCIALSEWVHGVGTYNALYTCITSLLCVYDVRTTRHSMHVSLG